MGSISFMDWTIKLDPIIFNIWRVQPFLSTEKKKDFRIKVFYIWKFPVLISGLVNIFLNGMVLLNFKWLIICTKDHRADEVLLDYSQPNYAGSWFNIVWPFCIAIL